MASKLKVEIPGNPDSKKGLSASAEVAPEVRTEVSRDLMEYTMAQAGVTEGVSGKRYAHDMKTVIDKKGRPQRSFFCVAPEGEFAHLYNSDGTSDAILGKRKI